jgi:hypothetical protein
MQIDPVLNIIVEALRSALIDVVSERVRRKAEALGGRGLQGMPAVRRHVLRRARRRLLHRLSTPE